MKTFDEKDLEADVDDAKDILRESNYHCALTPEKLKALRESSLATIAANDKIVEEGVTLFFSNRVNEAEEVFLKHMTSNTLCAAAAATIATVKAMLSMDQKDMNAAMKKITFAIAFSEQVLSAGNSVVTKVGSLFKWGGSKKITPGEFHAKAAMAQAFCLRGLVLLVQPNDLNSLIKCAVSIKRYYNTLKALRAEMDLRKKESGTDSYEDVGLDRNSVYSVLFALGCSNVILSILPPRILSILDLLGFTHNTEAGLKRVLMCMESGTLISPFAALFLMTVNTILPGFCPVLVSVCLPLAREVAEKVLKHPPLDESLNHLWVVGRICRLEKKMAESIAIFSNCMKLTERAQIAQSMPQLRNMVLYDQAWNYAISAQWNDSVALYSMLEKSSPLLKVFYAYVQGCCYELLGGEATIKRDKENALMYGREASQAYWRAAHYAVAVLGGKSAVFDVFVSVRLNEMFSKLGLEYPNPGNKKNLTLLTPSPPNGVIIQNIVPLAMLELFVLFDMLHQVPTHLLDNLLMIIDRESGRDTVDLVSPKGFLEGKVVDNPNHFIVNGKPMKVCQVFVLEALKAMVLCNIDERRREAYGLLEKTLMAASGYRGLKCSLSWVAPRVLYEQAALAFADGDLEKCSKLLSETRSRKSGQLLHQLIDTKLHLFAYAMRNTPVTTKT